MDYFDKRMALEVIKDAFTSLHTPEDYGFAVGLCGAFYMCGLLEEQEWRAFLAQIPATNDGSCKRCTGQFVGWRKARTPPSSH